MRLQYAPLLLIILTLIPLRSMAQDTSTTSTSPLEGLRAGVVLSQVSLTGDPGSGGSSAFGWGLEAAYKIESAFSLAARFVSSSPSSVDHRELNLGGEYSFGDFDSALPYAAFGIAVIENRFKADDKTGDAAGLYAGIGAGFRVSSSIWISPEFRFIKAFTTRAEIGGRTVDTVSDSYSFNARVSYLF